MEAVLKEKAEREEKERLEKEAKEKEKIAKELSEYNRLKEKFEK